MGAGLQDPGQVRLSCAEGPDHDVRGGLSVPLLLSLPSWILDPRTGHVVTASGAWTTEGPDQTRTQTRTQTSLFVMNVVYEKKLKLFSDNNNITYRNNNTIMLYAKYLMFFLFFLS